MPRVFLVLLRHWHLLLAISSVPPYRPIYEGIILFLVVVCVALCVCVCVCGPLSVGPFVCGTLAVCVALCVCEAPLGF